MLVMVMISACSGSNSSGVTVESLTATPQSLNLVVGDSRQASAVAELSDNTTQSVTNFANWSSADESIATVGNSSSNKGLITAVGAGTTSITVSLQGQAATIAVTVTSTVPPPGITSIEVSPATASIAAGTQQVFKATAIYDNNTTQDVTTTVSWTSTNTNVATISNAAGSQGTATGESLGAATIRAALNGVTGTAALEVTSAVATALSIAPKNDSVPLNQEKQFSATATFSDNTTQDVTANVQWSSDTTTVVTISNEAGTEGLATPVAEGMSTISALFQGISDSTALTVGPAITLTEVIVSPASASIPNGTTQQFVAEAVYSDSSVEDVTTQALWESLDETIATISNSAGTEGLATSVSPGGPIDIEASFDGLTGSATLTVTAAALESISVEPVNASVPVGNTQQFTATGSYSDGSNADLTDTVVWASSNTSVASISNGSGSEGLAGGNSVGSVTISASAGDISGTTGFTVTGATLEALQIEPTNQNLAKGFDLQFSAIGIYSDGSNKEITESVTWVSTDQSIATISNIAGTKGLATADSANTGTVQIQASIGEKLASTSLTVTNAVLQSIDVEPLSDDLPKGAKSQYSATGNFDDASTQDLTDQVVWNSSDSAKATITQTGLVSAVAVGDGAPIMISAEHAATGVNNQTDLTITDATIVSMTISPQNDSIANGRTRSFTATGVYSDNTTGDVTTQVAWASSDPAVATISNAAGSEGQAKGLDVGVVDITATITNSEMVVVDATATLEVTDAVLDSITVTPASLSLAKGTQDQLTATALYSDGSTPDVTADVTWSSSNGAVATVSNAVGNEGLVSAVAAGNALITAQFDGKTDSSAVTVTAATITQIDIEPLDPTMPKGTALNFVATATFTDASTQNVTTQVTWNSSDPAVADVSNASGTKGRVTATGSGNAQATISATLDGVTGQSIVTASDAALQTIVVTPANETITVGDTLQYTATGIFTDGATQDITGSVTWTTTDPSVATIQPASGLATGVSAGNTLVIATDPTPGSDVQGSTSLIVSDPAP